MVDESISGGGMSGVGRGGPRRWVQHSAGDRDMLVQYFANLTVVFHAVETEDRESRPEIYEQVRRILKLPRDGAPDGQMIELPPDFDWVDGHRAECLLAFLRPRAVLSDELAWAYARYAALVGEIDQVREDVEELRNALTNGPCFDDEDAAAKERELLDRARRYLARIVSRAHWANAERHIKRRIGQTYSQRVIAAVAITLAIFITGLSLSHTMLEECSLPACRSYTGLLLAACAGLLGATFSRLTTPSTSVQDLPIIGAKVQSGWPILLVRHAVGAIAAVILYFFFQSDLIDGTLFPDLSRIGFVALSDIGGNPAGSPEEAVRGTLDALRTAMQVNPASLPDILTAQLPILETALLQPQGPPSLAQGSVPNPDMSKLMVWSFLAGFSEVLVSNMLNRVSRNARGEPNG